MILFLVGVVVVSHCLIGSHPYFPTHFPMRRGRTVSCSTVKWFENWRKILSGMSICGSFWDSHLRLRRIPSSKKKWPKRHFGSLITWFMRPPRTDWKDEDARTKGINVYPSCTSYISPLTFTFLKDHQPIINQDHKIKLSFYPRVLVKALIKLWEFNFSL